MRLQERLYPLFSVVSKLYSIHQLVEESDQWLFMPFYHTISDEPLPYVQYLYPVKNSIEFEQELDFLLKHFEPVSMEDIHRHLTHQRVFDRPVFHLTFDDGMRGCYDLIAPILKKKGVPASFFINNDFVDNKKLFYRHQVSLLLHHLKIQKIDSVTLEQIKIILEDAQLYSLSVFESVKALKYEQQAIIQEIAEILKIDFQDFLEKESPYMTKTQILKLQKDGFHIGGHSIDHPKYDEIDLTEQLKQTKKSLDFIQKNFPADLKTFAFPFSSDMLSRTFFKKMENQMDISFGTSGLKLDRFSNHLHRFPMEGTRYSPQTLVRSAYFYYWIKRYRNRHILERKL